VISILLLDYSGVLNRELTIGSFFFLIGMGAGWIYAIPRMGMKEGEKIEESERC
jgi:hypothetical protein